MCKDANQINGNIHDITNIIFLENPIDELIDIGLSMGCEYMLKSEDLIEQLVSSYVI